MGLDGSRRRLQDGSSISWMASPRSNFTSCRVERLPMGTCVSIHPPVEPGSRLFQRFTARRASFGTVLVMNSQEFTDRPTGPKSDRRVRNPDFRFTLEGILEAPFGGDYLVAAEGLFGHAVREEWRFFGLPEPFHGAWGLSPLWMSPSSRYVSSLVPPRGGAASARDISFRCSLLTRASFAGRILGSMFFDRIERMESSAGVGRPTSLDVYGHGEVALRVILGFSGLPEGGRIPPGGYPSALAGIFADVHGGQVHRFSVYGVGWIFPREDSLKRVVLLLRMFPFQGFPQPPFFLVYEPPGSCFRGGVPLPQARSPSRPSPPKPVSGFGFLGRPPIHRCTEWRSVP